MLDVEIYDLALLDLGLPDIDGLTIVRHFRQIRPDLYILILTARDELEDRVAGLDLGADDYLVKPFHFDELVARIRALFRRDPRSRRPTLTHRDLELDPAARVVWHRGAEIHLTRKEFAILEYLMRNEGRLISAEELLDHVWEADVNPVTHVLSVHISSLRRKLGDSAQAPEYIETVVGGGYRLASRATADDGA